MNKKTDENERMVVVYSPVKRGWIEPRPKAKTPAQREVKPAFAEEVAR